MFERFTDQARRVIVVAQEAARDLGHDYIGTEHILIGLVRSGDSVASEVLASFGITAESVAEDVEREVGRGKHEASGHIPFTPEAKKVLELSLREALQLGHSDIGTEHVLFGLVREGRSAGARVLRQRGADAETVRGRVIARLTARGGGGGERLVTPRITPRTTPGWPGRTPQLQRVVPIARELDVEDGWRLALLSLEVWAALLDLRLTVFALTEDPPALRGDYTDWTLSDDLGTEYARLAEATGGPSWFRVGQIAFTPAPPPEATTLTLVLPAVPGRDQIELVVELRQGSAAAEAEFGG
jgi:Clp amino terminal domain, pathogenicity island component